MAVTVETTQNVAIHYEVASIGERILAVIVDYAIIVAYIFLIIELIDAFNLEGGFGDVGALVFYLPLFFYDPVCEIFFNGQSFGKKAMRIRVVKLDGSEPTLGSYLLRWMLRLVDSFPPPLYMVGLFVVAVSGKGQRLGDMAAGTTVIKLKPRVLLEDVLMPERESSYTPRYLEVTKLSDRDIAIIRDVWTASRKQSTRATVNALATRVATVIGVDEALVAQSPDAFLETVIRDYAYLTSGDEL